MFTALLLVSVPLVLCAADPCTTETTHLGIFLIGICPNDTKVVPVGKREEYTCWYTSDVPIVATWNFSFTAIGSFSLSTHGDYKNGYILLTVTIIDLNVTYITCGACSGRGSCSPENYIIASKQVKIVAFGTFK